MSNIGQAGDYRGLVLDRGLSKSSGGYLQLVINLQATEKWDPNNQVWTPYEYEDNEAQAFLNLVTSKEKENAINCRQIMRAFNWDGASFAALNIPDNGLATQIQWRMGMEIYNEEERCKVQGISAFDAAPGRAVEKLDVADARAIDAKYAAILKNLSGGPKPKTAKPAAPPAQTPAQTPAQAPAQPDPPVAVVAPVAPTTAMTEPVTKPKKRGRPATPKPTAVVSPAVSQPPVPAAVPMPALLTQAEAWEYVYNTANKAGKSDLDITNGWVKSVNEAGGDEKVGNWTAIATATLKELGV